MVSFLDNDHNNNDNDNDTLSQINVLAGDMTLIKRI